MKVMLLVGGYSSEFNISLHNAKYVKDCLIQEGYECIIVEYENDLLAKLESYNPNIVFLAMHGIGGEDGSIQSLLEILQIPYAGCNSVVSALCMCKLSAKYLAMTLDIRVPDFSIFSDNKDYSYPCILKQMQGGSSIGVCMINNKKELENHMQEGFWSSNRPMIEEYIKGEEISIGIWKGKVLPINIDINADKIWTHGNKIADEGDVNRKNYRSIDQCPITQSAVKEMCDATIKIWNKCGSPTFPFRVDFRYNIEDDKTYMLEINTCPGLGFTSIWRFMVCEIAGWDYADLLSECIECASRRGVERSV